MAEKKSFVMYMSWGPLFETLPKEQAGALIQAVYAYQKDPSYEPDDPILKGMFALLKATMEEDRVKYEEVCAKRAEAAKAKASKSMQMDANASKSMQLDPDNESESDSDNESDNDFDADKESLTGQKASCSEQSTEPTPDCDGLILNDGSEWWPTVERYKEYERCYPGVNVQREFAKMRSWCLDNPKKRKTRNGIARFVNSWLSKEQDSGARASPYMQSIQNRVTNVDDWSAALKEKLHDSG